ncbi:uncharacterized protein LOC141714739 [Apium graveolens]|uniref:uncharacterized protein LOC141714739 n=1 Tax=Apium graveolens TaxID=4045 RepID=UPI003D79C94A
MFIFNRFIKDLKLLWDQGEKVYDAYSQTEFTLCAIIFCTISDFPAYGNLSGYTIKGAKACPICEDATIDRRLNNFKKNVYMGHRTFLPPNHPYQKRKKSFDGHTETRVARFPLTRKQVLERVKYIDVVLGKLYKKPTSSSIWKKRSIFWDLPYWEHLQDIIKYTCKTKDGINSRLDMQEMGIRTELAPQQSGKLAYLPPACYTLCKKEKISFFECLSSVKVPSGYFSNPKTIISMKDLKLVGMKSHDCHVLMQHLLLIAIRGILPKEVRVIITKLCFFFIAICSKVIDPMNLDKLQADIIVTLCEFEIYFTPALFDIMVHLVVHLEHISEIQQMHPSKSGKMITYEHNRSFARWFKDRVISQYSQSHNTISNTLKWLAYGLDMLVRSYKGYDISGYTFYIHCQDNKSTVQNSGVSVEASSTEFIRGSSSESRDLKNSYYGVIEEIWELDYKDFKVALFRCKWFDIRRGVRVDDLGFTLVDFSRFGHEDDPFIFVTQVKQVLYIRDPSDSRWSIILESKRRILGIDNVEDEEEFAGNWMIHIKKVLEMAVKMWRDFKEISDKAKKSQKHNLHVHYLGPNGYSARRVEWLVDDPITYLSNSESTNPLILPDELTGCTYDWVRARTKKKEGGGYYFPNEQTKQVFEKMLN